MYGSTSVRWIVHMLKLKGNIGMAPLISQHSYSINPAAIVAATHFYLDAGR